MGDIINPTEGNLVLTVTDAQNIIREKDEQNILSYMLLSSDLKGSIEDPGYYFNDSNSQTREKLDLVMLTNGWRRYEFSSILKDETPKIHTTAEDSQMIKGSVTGLFGKADKPQILVIDNNTNKSGVFELNEYNNFLVTGIEAYCSSTYIIQALNKNGKNKDVGIKIESDNYPLIIPQYMEDHVSRHTNKIPSLFLEQAKEKYFNDGGEKVVDIEEIVVATRRINSPFYTIGHYGTNMHGDFSKYGKITDVLATFKELYLLGANIYVRPEFYKMPEQRWVLNNVARRRIIQTEQNGTELGLYSNEEEQSSEKETDYAEINVEDNTPPTLIVNGEEINIEHIDYYETKYLERIAFIDPNAAYMLGLNTPTGCIMMDITKEGVKNFNSSGSMAQYAVRACDKPTEFFKQKYDIPNTNKIVKDLRTTIAWEPSFVVKKDGTTTDFYTSDNTGYYDVLIEGISTTGELCHTLSRIKVE